MSDDLKVCGSGTTDACLGVKGSENLAPRPQGTFQFKQTNKYYADFVSKYNSTDSMIACATKTTKEDGTTGSLCMSDRSGYPIPGLNQHKCQHACFDPFTLDIDNLETNGQLLKAKKLWGSNGTTWTHGGCVPENVAVAKNIAVNYKPAEGADVPDAYSSKSPINTSQSTIQLSMRGDLFSGKGVTGLEKITGIGTKKTLPNIATYASTTSGLVSAYTPKPLGQDNLGIRTGACVVTRNMYGPGYYECVARLPRVNSKDHGLTGTLANNAGYVFAMWTFSYTEAYLPKLSSNPQIAPIYYQGVTECPITNTKKFNPLYLVGTNLCDGSTCNKNVNGMPCPLQPGCSGEGGLLPGPPFTGCNMHEGVDYFTVINHEIDIEIPSNAPQWIDKNTNDFSTWNMNTWISDNQDYSADGYNYYSQLGTRLPKGSSFVSEKGEFHKYAFLWEVNDDNTENKVTFYFDDKKIFTSTRFVPLRAGRLWIGPWPGWWSNNKRGLPYDSVTVDIASIRIIPSTNGPTVNFPQAYDQVDETMSHILVDGVVDWDGKDLTADNYPKCAKCVTDPTPDPDPDSKEQKKDILIGAIVYVVIGVIILIVWVLIKYFTRQKGAVAPK